QIGIFKLTFIPLKIAHGSLTESLAIFIGHGVLVRWLFSYRNVFDYFYSVFKEHWLVSLSKHIENTICFDGITNLPNREAWNGMARFHEKRENLT
ncbi:hypothetical protein, partial [Globicatella sp. HMSC072A10]|uniref:hypothetical protein n=1 Tax=Globicatella sp. HMSC072A10 TaxID=1739315 RepID=UPI001AF00653